jgi:hypothetical protein
MTKWDASSLNMARRARLCSDGRMHIESDMLEDIFEQLEDMYFEDESIELYLCDNLCAQGTPFMAVQS